MAKATTASAGHAILCVAQTKGRFGFAWGVGDTSEEAEAICKKEGGDMKTKKIKEVPHGTWLDDMGGLHYPNPKSEK